MADPYRHVRRGDPPGIPVEAWNSLMDLRRPVVGAPAAARPSNSFTPEAGVILVRNDSGANRACFDVLGLDEPLIDHGANTGALDEFARRIAFKGITPASGHARKFCILQEAIPSGETGRAISAGMTIARINVSSAPATFVKAGAGTTTALVQADDGVAEVLWVQSGTGDGKYAIVRIASGDGSAGANGNYYDCEATDAGRDHTLAIYRAFGGAFSHNVSGTLRPDFTRGQFYTGTSGMSWTHYADVASNADILHGCTHTAGTCSLNYADGDEVRVTIEGLAHRFVVVWIGFWNGFKRVYLMRHSVTW